MFLSQPPIATKPSKPSAHDDRLDRVGDHFARHQRVTHAGRAHRDAVGHGDGVEDDRFAAGFIGAHRRRVRERVDVHVARRQRAAGRRDADLRLREVGIGETDRAQHRARRCVDETVDDARRVAAFVMVMHVTSGTSGQAVFFEPFQHHGRVALEVVHRFARRGEFVDRGVDETLFLEPVARLRRQQEQLIESQPARLRFDLADQRGTVRPSRRADSSGASRGTRVRRRRSSSNGYSAQQPMMLPSSSATKNRSISRSSRSRGRRTSTPAFSSGRISSTIPATSSAVARRMCWKPSSLICVPQPIAVNSSRSSAPSSRKPIRWLRGTPARHARSSSRQPQPRRSVRTSRYRAASRVRSATDRTRRAVGVDYRRGRVERDQLVGAERDRDVGREFFARQIERFTGRRVAERRQQHDATLVQHLMDAFAVDAPHATGEQVVDAVDDAERPRGDEIARQHVNLGVVQRRVRQTHREQSLDAHAHARNRRFDLLDRRLIGDAAMIVETRRQSGRGNRRVDLRSRTVHEHDAHTEHRQQREVVHDVRDVVVHDRIAAEQDDEGLVPVRADVRRRVAEPARVLG